MRLLDVAADGRAHGAFDDLHGAPDGATFADRLREATATHYGTAGPAFVAAFLGGRESAMVTVRDAMEAFRITATSRLALVGEGQVSRATAQLELVAAAGKLATAFGLTGWPSGAAVTAALNVLGVWLDGCGGSGAAEGEAVERTRAFLVARGDARFEPIARGADDGRSSTARAGRGRYLLHCRRHMARDPPGRRSFAGRPPSARRWVPSSGRGQEPGDKGASRHPGRPRAYAVTADILGAGDG